MWTAGVSCCSCMLLLLGRRHVLLVREMRKVGHGDRSLAEGVMMVGRTMRALECPVMKGGSVLSLMYNFKILKSCKLQDCTLLYGQWIPVLTFTPYVKKSNLI